MSSVDIILYVLMASASLSAIAILFIKNVFNAALLLLLCLLSVAGIYAILYAEFLAVTQILIYAGGVVVILLFGIMLTTKTTGLPLIVGHTNKFSGFVLGSTTLYLLVTTFSGYSIELPHSGKSSVRETGIMLVTDYVLPFEVTGLLLLVALIAAAVMSSNKSSASS